MSEAEAAILSAIADLRKEVVALRAGASVALPEDAQAAVEARAAAQARGYHTVETFASVTGLHPRTVSDRCRVRVIRTLPAGAKTYHIPLSEESRVNGQNGF